MKNVMKFFALAVVILGFSATSFGQISANAAASASATILKPISITKATDLNFGTVGASTSNVTTVVLGTDNSRTLSTATLYTVGAPAAAGEFSILGTPDAAFSITLPAVVTDLVGTGTNMTINSTDWVSSLSTTNAALDHNGEQTLKIGATLQVGVNQAPGSYTGTFEVTVAYN